MKHIFTPFSHFVSESPPVRGAWIETVEYVKVYDLHWSPPVRGAWIETSSKQRGSAALLSPPVRGAWIETEVATTLWARILVASREGGVD